MPNHSLLFGIFHKYLITQNTCTAPYPSLQCISYITASPIHQIVLYITKCCHLLVVFYFTCTAHLLTTRLDQLLIPQ